MTYPTQRPGNRLERTTALVSILILLLLSGSSLVAAQARNPGAPAQVEMTSSQIVDQMQRCNEARMKQLKHYESVRHYQVDYHGFALKLEAAMDVAVNYDQQSGKTFRILKESGSKSLFEQVLKRAIESEQEAQHEKASTALTNANYKFHFDGKENLQGRLAYVLDLEPLVKSRFVYQGKIWVDATDFAVVQMEVQPAKNPSLWISRTLIRQSYAKTGGFWLPERNQSETQVRIGGTAVLTIDYGTYQIASQ